MTFCFIQIQDCHSHSYKNWISIRTATQPHVLCKNTKMLIEKAELSRRLDLWQTDRIHHSIVPIETKSLPFVSTCFPSGIRGKAHLFLLCSWMTVSSDMSFDTTGCTHPIDPTSQEDHHEIECWEFDWLEGGFEIDQGHRTYGLWSTGVSLFVAV